MTSEHRSVDLPLLATPAGSGAPSSLVCNLSYILYGEVGHPPRVIDEVRFKVLSMSLRMSTKLSFLAVPLFVTAFQFCGAQQLQNTGQDWTPEKVVDQLWRAATQGELLSDIGWERINRAFFVTTPLQPGTKLIHHDESIPDIIKIVSNDWGVANSTVQGTQASVIMEYYDAGSIDRKLRYTPGLEPPPIGKTETVYKLTFAPGYRETYEAKGTDLVTGEVQQSPPAWRIESPKGLRWTTVNTAVRYVLEAREKTSDPEVKQNADRTIKS